MQEMKHYGKIASKLFELSFSEPVSAVYDISIKGGLQVVNQHLKPSYFNFIDLGRNNFQYLMHTERLIKTQLVKRSRNI